MTIATAAGTTHDELDSETCPNCGATVANVQGLTDCTDCTWTEA